jgi:hypothetical protein
MWLVYLRFDDQGKTCTYHVRTGSKADMQEIVCPGCVSESARLLVRQSLLE